MKLHAPFEISSRLMAALQVGGAMLSLQANARNSEGRTVYSGFIDLPDGSEHELKDLRSGRQGGSLQEGFESLLSFLSAAAESYQYDGLNGENSDLFAEPIVRWAADHTDDLDMISYEIQESKADLIEE